MLYLLTNQTRVFRQKPNYILTSPNFFETYNPSLWNCLSTTIAQYSYCNSKLVQYIVTCTYRKSINPPTLYLVSNTPKVSPPVSFYSFSLTIPEVSTCCTDCSLFQLMAGKCVRVLESGNKHIIMSTAITHIFWTSKCPQWSPTLWNDVAETLKWLSNYLIDKSLSNKIDIIF